MHILHFAYRLGIIGFMSLLKKVALIFPPLRRVRDDLHNRRQLAEEYETANTILKNRNAELVEQLEVMKSEMMKALELKKMAVKAKTGNAAKAEHFSLQLANMTAKYERLKDKIAILDAEICHYRLENDALIRKLALNPPETYIRKTQKKKQSSSTSARKTKVSSRKAA